MPRKKPHVKGRLEKYVDESDRRFNIIDQKLDSIAHVKVNGSVGLEPALRTLYDLGLENRQNIEQIKEETQLMRDLHRVYMIYKKYAPVRFVVKVVFVLVVGQLVGLSVKEIIGHLK